MRRLKLGKICPPLLFRLLPVAAEAKQSQMSRLKGTEMVDGARVEIGDVTFGERRGPRAGETCSRLTGLFGDRARWLAQPVVALLPSRCAMEGVSKADLIRGGPVNAVGVWTTVDPPVEQGGKTDRTDF